MTDKDPAAEDLGEPVAEISFPTKGRRWSPERARESLRSIIAIASFALFASVILILLLSVAVGHRAWSDLEGVATATIPAVTSVVSAAIGFYYGTQGSKS
jgi:hypothetical protein